MYGGLQVHSEEEIRRVAPIAKKHGVPITFRAAGTSLSGQAVTDSVLLKLSHTGKNFRNYKVHVSKPSFRAAALPERVCASLPLLHATTTLSSLWQLSPPVGLSLQ
jgi:hypothetical protein